MTIATELPTITLEEVVAAVRDVRTGTVMQYEGNLKRFNDGVSVGGHAEYVTIAVNNVWGATNLDGSSTSSYEKIGYHAGSMDFIAGVLRADCPVIVYRTEDDGSLGKYQLQ